MSIIAHMMSTITLNWREIVISITSTSSSMIYSWTLWLTGISRLLGRIPNFYFRLPAKTRHPCLHKF
jgi:hypothetical protein